MMTQIPDEFGDEEPTQDVADEAPVEESAEEYGEQDFPIAPPPPDSDLDDQNPGFEDD